jgi:hypothetical protein
MNGLINSDWAINQNQLGQLQSGCYGYQLYQSAPVEREPRARELVIERIGDALIRLDYGAELRLLIADPLRGSDLREALQKLKEALQNAGPHL